MQHLMLPKQQQQQQPSSKDQQQYDHSVNPPFWKPKVGTVTNSDVPQLAGVDRQKKGKTRVQTTWVKKQQPIIEHELQELKADNRQRPQQSLQLQLQQSRQGENQKKLEVIWVVKTEKHEQIKQNSTDQRISSSIQSQKQNPEAAASAGVNDAGDMLKEKVVVPAAKTEARKQLERTTTEKVLKQKERNHDKDQHKFQENKGIISSEHYIELKSLRISNALSDKQSDRNSCPSYWRCVSCGCENHWWQQPKCFVCFGSSLNQAHPRMKIHSDQSLRDIDFLLFVDFECNQNYKTSIQEIIEFPIHVIDVKTKKIIESFHTFIRPNSRISSFITKLTTITQQTVRNAPNLKQALDMVAEFIKPYQPLCAVVYDCDSDASFLLKETSSKKFSLPPVFESFINLREIFPTKITKEDRARIPKSMKEMLSFLNMKFEGKEHVGNDDARNQALIGVKLLELDCVFTSSMIQPLAGWPDKLDKYKTIKILPCEAFFHIEFDPSPPTNDSSCSSSSLPFTGVSCSISFKEENQIALIMPVKSWEISNGAKNDQEKIVFLRESIRNIASLLRESSFDQKHIATISSTQKYSLITYVVEMYKVVSSSAEGEPDLLKKDFWYILSFIESFIQLKGNYELMTKKQKVNYKGKNDKEEREKLKETEEEVPFLVLDLTKLDKTQRLLTGVRILNEVSSKGKVVKPNISFLLN